jgi:predicted kinase
VPLLVLLNGAPASGKSTVAAALVDRRPLSLNLDIDVVRGQLGRWLDEPTEAGLAARSLAVAMARTHLRSGRDVIVPQFLARAGFAGELETLATECDAEFVSIALIVDRDTARSSFAARSDETVERTHRDAAAMVDRSPDTDPIGDMFDRFVTYLDSRSDIHRIDANRGAIDHTVRAVEDILSRYEPEILHAPR